MSFWLALSLWARITMSPLIVTIERGRGLRENKGFGSLHHKRCEVVTREELEFRAWRVSSSLSRVLLWTGACLPLGRMFSNSAWLETWGGGGGAISQLIGRDRTSHPDALIVTMAVEMTVSHDTIYLCYYLFWFWPARIECKWMNPLLIVYQFMPVCCVCAPGERSRSPQSGQTLRALRMETTIRRLFLSQEAAE